MNTSSLISAAELLEVLNDPDLRVIDARFELTDPTVGAAEYARGRIPGAVHLDLNEDMSSQVGSHGGRHPLPDMVEFAARLGQLGISRQNPVVVYDQSGAMYAARAWWLLRHAGHDNVRFLDGGLAAYLAVGGQLSQQPSSYPPTDFELRLRPEMVVTVDDVKESLGSENVALLDARAGERFRGEVEPLDPKAGHIPGALNRFYLDAQEDGLFKSREQLVEFFGPVLGKPHIVAYCGSGVSGAHLLLALEQAGVKGAKLYAGSWSDWSSYEDLPVETGA